MAKYNFWYLEELKRAQGSPAETKEKIHGLISRSEYCTPKVENWNTDTGEYCVVVQGTIWPERAEVPEYSE